MGAFAICLGPAGGPSFELEGMLSFFAFSGLAEPILLTLSLARYLEALAGCRVACTVAFVELGYWLIKFWLSRSLRLDEPASKNGYPGLSEPRAERRFEPCIFTFLESNESVRGPLLWGRRKFCWVLLCGCPIAFCSLG